MCEKIISLRGLLIPHFMQSSLEKMRQRTEVAAMLQSH
jgi:hypothetical protein